MLREELLKLPSIDLVVFSYCEPYKIGKLNVSVFMFEHVALAGEETTSVGSGKKSYFQAKRLETYASKQDSGL